MMETILKFSLGIMELFIKLYIKAIFALLGLIGRAVARIIADTYSMFLVRRAAGRRTARRAMGRSSSRHL
ncbi:hypothetical protein [Agrobacterium sp. LAD9]|uniref:hypothetical protein n=1 Tax=Agrobacterium sp. LAD9 TaxID=2055153 RepID=UPI00128FE8CD|nr:hypothetical protein [Agrobacterium sp. LAD9]